MEYILNYIKILIKLNQTKYTRYISLRVGTEKVKVYVNHVPLQNRETVSVKTPI